MSGSEPCIACVFPRLHGHRGSNVSPQTPSRHSLFKAARFQHFGAFTEELQGLSPCSVAWSGGRPGRADPVLKGSWLFTLSKINFLDVPRICLCHAAGASAGGCCSSEPPARADEWLCGSSASESGGSSNGRSRACRCCGLSPVGSGPAGRSPDQWQVCRCQGLGSLLRMLVGGRRRGGVSPRGFVAVTGPRCLQKRPSKWGAHACRWIFSSHRNVTCLRGLNSIGKGGSLEAERLVPTTSHLLRQAIGFSAVRSRGKFSGQRSRLQYRPQGRCFKVGRRRGCHSLRPEFPLHFSPEQAPCPTKLGRDGDGSVGAKGAPPVPAPALGLVLETLPLVTEVRINRT